MINSPFSVVHADAHLVVVHKAAGLLTVPAHGGPCLVDLLQAALDRESFGRHRVAVIHRLDRETSGLLVFARSPAVAAPLAKQFAAHSVEREYVAIVSGKLQTDAGTFSGRLDGKRAVTHYTVRERGDAWTLVALTIETGRRNQIRRHAADAGHPVLGDARFRPDLARPDLWPHTRLALHASVLGFIHPATKECCRFEAAPPDEFAPFDPDLSGR